MAIKLLDLPHEILTQIISSLSLRDLLSATSACTTLRALLQSFTPLQYRLALLSSGYIDNPGYRCPLVLSERLAALRAREAAWRAAKVKRTTRIATPHGGPTGIYDFTGGLYFLGLGGSGITGEITREMRWVRLPSADNKDLDENQMWTSLDIGEDIIDIGLNVHELDLIAVATSKPAPLATEPSRTISIHLLQLSTGNPHPAAQTYVLPMVTIPLRAGRSTIGLEASGPTLLFLATFPESVLRNAPVHDQLWAIDWRTGAKRAFLAARSGTYAGIALLAHDACVLPNMLRGTLELFRLPSSLCSVPSQGECGEKEAADRDSSTPVLASLQVDDFALPVLMPARVLALPELAQGCRILQANCRAEPGPVGRAPLTVGFGMVGEKDARPFAEDPAEAILLVTLMLAGQALWGEDLEEIEFVVHRSVLLEMLQPSLEEEDVQREISRGEGVEAGADAKAEEKQLEEDREQLREGNRERMVDDDTDGRELLDIPFFSSSLSASSSVAVAAPYPRTNTPGRASPKSSSEVLLPSMRGTSTSGSSLMHPKLRPSNTSSHGTRSSASSIPPLATGSSSSSSLLPDVIVPWRAWGPPVTRWLKLDAAQSNWITTTSGQRHALLRDDLQDAGQRLRVLDFGRVRAAKGLVLLRRARTEEEAKSLATEAPVESASKEELAALTTADVPALVVSKEDDAPPSYEPRESEEVEVLDEHVVGAWEDADDWVSDDELESDDGVLADGVLVGADDAPLTGRTVLDAGAPDVRFIAGPSVIKMPNFFVDDLCSSLPYFEACSSERYMYESVLIDEERVLGLVTNAEDDVIALDVIQFE